MRIHIISLITLSLLAPSIQAQEKKLKYEKLLQYEGVSIVKVTGSSISIIHKSGVASIPIEDLPEEIRTNLGMSLEKSKEHREALAEKKKKSVKRTKMKQTLEKNRLIFIGSIFQVTERGLLLKGVSYTDGTNEKIKVPYKVRSGGPNGLNPNRRYVYTTKYKYKWVLKVRQMNSWPIFIECDNTGYVDGATFSGTVYADGTFAYTNVQGARKTIPSYTTDGTKVLKRNGH